MKSNDDTQTLATASEVNATANTKQQRKRRILQFGFEVQMLRKSFSPAMALALACRAALELYANGWRTSDSILHRADNPIPAPDRPRLPSIRLAA